MRRSPVRCSAPPRRRSGRSRMPTGRSSSRRSRKRSSSAPPYRGRRFASVESVRFIGSAKHGGKSMGLELSQLESTVRRAYERGRLVHALRVTAPLLALGAFALLLDRRPAVMLGLGGLLFVTEALFVWRGQQLGRGALAGLAGGAIPLAFGLCMQVYARWCGGMAQMPGCTTICPAGGLLAGLWIAWFARRQPSPLAFPSAAAVTA